MLVMTSLASDEKIYIFPNTPVRGLFETLDEFKTFIRGISHAGGPYIHSTPIQGPGARGRTR
jgi:hypothetical protein